MGVAQAVSRIAVAKGRIIAPAVGGLEYSIDPATIRTEVLGVQALELKSISFDPEPGFEEVTLKWASVPGRNYTIQFLNEFLCWEDYIFTFAIDETELTEKFFPKSEGIDLPETQIYRVIETVP